VGFPDSHLSCPRIVTPISVLVKHVTSTGEV
jgi:hypothetical protein